MQIHNTPPIHATLSYKIVDRWNNFTPGFTFIREPLTDEIIKAEHARLMKNHPHAVQILMTVDDGPQGPVV